MVFRVLLIIVLFVYVGLFQAHEQQSNRMQPHISMALPAPIQKIVLGYLKEVGEEIVAAPPSHISLSPHAA